MHVQIQYLMNWLARCKLQVTLIVSGLSVCIYVCVYVCLFVCNFDAKYLGN